MILQRLAEYYDRASDDPANAGTLPRPGYSLQKISFCVVLTPDGQLQQFQSLLDENGKRPRPRQILVPGQSKPPGSGLNPGFLWDNAAYMLGFKADDPKPERTAESFETFRARHLLLGKELDSPAFHAVCAFLHGWSSGLAASHSAELSGIVGSFGVFRIASTQRFVHDDPEVIAWWQSQTSQTSGEGASAVHGFCLVSGRDGPLARLHEPKIKGVRGSQSSGALLVSFNDRAYESFGRQQSFNAPVSTASAFKYANALNYLLARQDRRALLGETTVVFWAERPTPLERFISDLFAEVPGATKDASPEDRSRADDVRLFLSELRQGHAVTDVLADEDGTRFFVLGLSPNASRLSVRFWSDSTVGEMKARLGQHMRDVGLAGARDWDPPLTIGRIVQAAGRAEKGKKGGIKYHGDSVPPLLAGAVARAVLAGGPYPQALLAAMINRLRSDSVIAHPRVAAIKACIVRNSRLRGNPKEVSVSLDTSRADSAYVTGRLFALLEKIQEDSSDGRLNTTVKDRYFSSASATPGVVFPRLIRLSQHHLAKIEGGLKIYREKQLGEIMNKLDYFPGHLSLEDQGLFAIGYFHQRQDLYTSKDKKQNGGETE